MKWLQALCWILFFVSGFAAGVRWRVYPSATAQPCEDPGVPAVCIDGKATPLTKKERVWTIAKLDTSDGTNVIRYECMTDSELFKREGVWFPPQRAGFQLETIAGVATISAGVAAADCE